VDKTMEHAFQTRNHPSAAGPHGEDNG